MSDSVNKPAHYNAGSVETIDGIRAALGDGFADYCKGNVLKYVWRCGKKGDAVEDLKKAATYLQWAIEAMEGNCPVKPDSSSDNRRAIPKGCRLLEKSAKAEPRKTGDFYWSTMLAKWRFLETDQVEYANRYDWPACRKIETANPSEAPNSSKPDPLNCIGHKCDLAESTGVTCPVDSCDLDTGVREAPAEPQPSNPSENPNGSQPAQWMPKVGEFVVRPCGRPAKVISIDSMGGHLIYGCEGTNSRFTLGTLKPWVPKVGDKVRVVGDTSILRGCEGVINEVSRGVAFPIYFISEDFKRRGWCNLRHLELIEAAS